MVFSKKKSNDFGQKVAVVVQFEKCRNIYLYKPLDFDVKNTKKTLVYFFLDFSKQPDFEGFAIIETRSQLLVPKPLDFTINR